MADRLAEFRAVRERINTRIVIPHLRRTVDMPDRPNAGESPESAGHAEHGA